MFPDVLQIMRPEEKKMTNPFLQYQYDWHPVWAANSCDVNSLNSSGSFSTTNHLQSQFKIQANLVFCTANS